MEKLILILMIPFWCLLIFIIQSVYSVEAEARIQRASIRRTQRIAEKRVGRKAGLPDKIQISEKKGLLQKNNGKIVI